MGAPEATTVADDLVVLHDGVDVHAFHGLAGGQEYTFLGVEVRTLVRPPGELLCRFATANDVHFGELECGRLDDNIDGPIQRADPGDEPYPEMMNRGAVAEMLAIDPAAVIVKGDLTLDGADDEYTAFLRVYGVLGNRLHHVRGNHDSYHRQTYASGDQRIEVPGATIALLDTAIPGETTGRLTADQLDWLDAVAAEAVGPALVMGHHQQWIGGKRSADYFGLDPDSSDGLAELVARRTSVVGYFSGHTHRNRVRPMSGTGVASVEVACVKDFPGSWAEYRVYDGGVMQVHHRVSTPEALAWSERCRYLYRDFGIDYATYALGSLTDRCFTVLTR